MSTIIENDFIRVRIRSKGAELYSVFNKKTALEYMWSGDPFHWAKTSPVLFPVVGALKANSYHYDNKEFILPRHGFARDHLFELESQSWERVSFILRDNEDTRNQFPFPFLLRIVYQLNNALLTVSYEVINKGDAIMYFSLGAHPAFKVPLLEESSYEDYYLEFNSTEEAPCFRLSPEGLIKNETYSVLHQVSKLPLKKSLFYQDALVFKNLKSDCISLKSIRHSHGLDFSFAGFPYFGLWAAKDADFICLEPWSGIADRVDHNQQLMDKEGIQELKPGLMWSRNWSIKSY